MEQETKQQVPVLQKCEHCNGYCHSHHGGIVWKLFKGLLMVIVLLLVLMVGVAAGRKSTMIKGVKLGNNMVQLQLRDKGEAGVPDKMFYINTGSGPMMPGMPSKMSVGVTRMAGVVSAIDGNKITISDNGGEKQVLYTTASTIITTSKGEIPLSDLKTKEFIVSFITVKDGKNTAESIQVQ